MKPNEGKLRRNRQGQATAFKTPEPVLFLIEMIEGGQNQLMAYFADSANSVLSIKRIS